MHMRYVSASFCTIVVSGSSNVYDIIQTIPQLSLAAGNDIFACCHKSSASAKQRRVTITLGFATLSSCASIFVPAELLSISVPNC